MIAETEPQKPDVTEKIPKWLRHAQQNSWEGEILISGGAIFSLFQASAFLSQQKVFFGENFPFKGLDEILVLSMIAVEGLTFSFVFHLLVRGVWIALLSVNGLFPGGINFSKLSLSQKYRNKIQSTTLTTQVLFLDKIAGLAFYAGFAFSLLVCGLFLCMTVLFVVAQLIPGSMYVLIPLLIVYFLDFTLAGPLRRKNTIGRIYYPVYYFFSFITLSFLYRKSIQIVFSNINRIQAAAFIVVFIICTLTLSYFSLYKVLHQPAPFEGRALPGTRLNEGIVYINTAYLDQIDDSENIRWFAIESDVITDDLMRVYVNYHSHYHAGIIEASKNSLDDIVTLTIDSDTLRMIDWMSEKRLRASQEGIMAMIPVGQLTNGKHIITLDVRDEYFKRIKPIRIPFWKE